ncbi:DUF305 domain-containing protein [Rhodococcus sp. HNM0563]|uniref:DUF305 domain-containing protein n=1 Tax=Rhodococcus sp. HNM0563 TaxID=2716339 RepID=UPI00146F3BED|nr:DUF305 domain-containing protein [Rhodococcus sp. HNM0563]NLU61528.1 DUF305 domain-containing protein [Rhodococcus sp. HNM0563]
MRTRSWLLPAVTALLVAVCLTTGFLIGRSSHGEHPDAAMVQLSDRDVEFAQHMSVHHQQAITMVDLLGTAVSSDVGAVAGQIRASQWREIGTLTGWLELVGAPFQAAASQGGHGDHTVMAGMASNEDLTRLHETAGPEREVLFLQLMIRHHQGGIKMAAAALDTTAVPAVRARALSMVDEQQQELASMSLLLDARGASVLPYP